MKRKLYNENGEEEVDNSSQEVYTEDGDELEDFVVPRPTKRITMWDNTPKQAKGKGFKSCVKTGVKVVIKPIFYIKNRGNTIVY